MTSMRGTGEKNFKVVSQKLARSKIVGSKRSLRLFVELQALFSLILLS